MATKSLQMASALALHLPVATMGPATRPSELKPLKSVMAWEGAQMAEDAFIFCLTAEEVAEVDAALGAFQGVPMLDNASSWAQHITNEIPSHRPNTRPSFAGDFCASNPRTEAPPPQPPRARRRGLLCAARPPAVALQAPREYHCLYRHCVVHWK